MMLWEKDIYNIIRVMNLVVFFVLHLLLGWMDQLNIIIYKAHSIDKITIIGVLNIINNVNVNVS